MARKFSFATVRLIVATAGVLLLAIGVAQAEFIVSVSDNPPAAATSSQVLDAKVGPGTIGQLYLYGRGDTRLSGLSLDVLAAGNAIRFTSAQVHNPGGRWSFLDGPLVVMDNQVTNIGGAAIPPSTPGVGGPIAEEIPGVGFLLATLGYQANGPLGSLSQISLRVGSNLIADYEGVGAPVRLGGPNAPLVNGENAGASGVTGSIGVVPEPATCA